MSERDKLIAQAEALEWAVAHVVGDYVLHNRIVELRALAAQQPVEEPVAWLVKDGGGNVLRYDAVEYREGDIPLYTHSQSSAPADSLRNMTEADFDKAHGVTDLDALVARLGSKGYQWFEQFTWPLPNLYDEAATAITDLRALSVTNIMLDVVPGFDGCGEEIYAKSVKDVEQCMSKMGIQIDEQAATITDLRAQLTVMRDLWKSECEESAKRADSLGKAFERITRLEAERDNLLVEIDHCRDNADNAQRYEQERDAAIKDNAKARELLFEHRHGCETTQQDLTLGERTDAFLAKQGDTP